MANQRLRDSLLRNGITTDDVAARVGVDPKTVERWMTKGRTPYPKHRHTIAAMLREAESYLWPDALDPETSAAVAESEVVKVYPNRNAIPHEVWDRLLDQATARVDVLVYVGMFLTENPAFVPALRAKGADGRRVRLLFGDPDSREVQRRSTDEGIGKGAISAKIRNALAFYSQLEDAAGVEVRCHGTTLYNSIYRYDDEMIVNPHVYGIPAPHAPALHLRRLSAGSMFETYAQSFDTVWETAKLPKWSSRGVPKSDYYDDPAAPPANSLVVAVAAVVLDDLGRVLMIERADNGLWAIPGGAQDVGETTAAAAVREVREDTGLDAEITGLVGIYSDPRHVIAYDDGEVRQEFSICFRARPIGGRLTPSTESKQVHWVDPDRLAELNIHRSVRLRIKHGLEHRDEPHLS